MIKWCGSITESSLSFRIDDIGTHKGSQTLIIYVEILHVARERWKIFLIEILQSATHPFSVEENSEESSR